MRRALGQALRIGVSAQAVSLLCTSRWRGEAVTVLAEHAFAPSADHLFDAIAQALRALLGEFELAGWPVSFVVADDLVRLWQITPPAGATRMADLEAAAGLRFHALYGDSPATWQISADWNVQKPFFAAAMPRALLAELALVAQEYKLSVVGIAPHFVAAWNRWCRAIQSGGWFALVHEQVLTLAVMDAAQQGAVRAIRALPVPAGADQQWLAQTIKREALLQNVEAPALLQVCGTAPSSWLRAAGGSGAAAASGEGAAVTQLACVALDQAERAGPQTASPVVLLAR